MDLEELKLAVEAELSHRKRKVLNRNALDALLAAVPVGPLIQLFANRKGALDAERRRIQIDLILDLLAQFDTAITELQRSAQQRGVSIAGLIEATGRDADEVTGARIRPDVQNVEFQPGTHIRAEGERVKRITGLEIGGE